MNVELEKAKIDEDTRVIYANAGVFDVIDYFVASKVLHITHGFQGVNYVIDATCEVVDDKIICTKDVKTDTGDHVRKETNPFTYKELCDEIHAVIDHKGILIDLKWMIPTSITMDDELFDL